MVIWQVKNALRLSLLSALACIALFALISFYADMPRELLARALSAAVIFTFFIPLSYYLAVDVLFFQARRFPALLNACAFFLLMAAVNLLVCFVIGRLLFPEMLKDPLTINVTLAMCLSLGMIMTFSYTLRHLVGRHRFEDIFIGRYRTPSKYPIMCCVVHLTDAPAWAEELPPKRFFSLLNRFFGIVETCARMHDGQIHAYLEDNIIVIWPESADGTQKSFRFMADLLHGFTLSQARFTARFGKPIEYTAGFHAGTVLAGEVGNERREISFWGDVIHIANRLQKACKLSGNHLLISSEAFHVLAACHIATPDQVIFERLDGVILDDQHRPIDLIKPDFKD